MNNSPSAQTHSLHEHQGHLGWNSAYAPALTIDPGETITFHPKDASGGQISASSTVADIATLDFSRVNPVVWPVYVNGADPDDDGYREPCGTRLGSSSHPRRPPVGDQLGAVTVRC